MKFETNNTILTLCCKFYIYNLKKKIYILYNHNNIVLLSFFFNNLSTIFYLYKNQNHVLIFIMLANF